MTRSCSHRNNTQAVLVHTSDILNVGHLPRLHEYCWIWVLSSCLSNCLFLTIRGTAIEKGCSTACTRPSRPVRRARQGGVNTTRHACAPPTTAIAPTNAAPECLLPPHTDPDWASATPNTMASPPKSGPTPASDAPIRTATAPEPCGPEEPPPASGRSTRLLRGLPGILADQGPSNRAAILQGQEVQDTVKWHTRPSMFSG